MPYYSLGIRTTASQTTRACFELRADPLIDITLREIGVTLVAATASVFGLGRPQAKGITPGSPVALIPNEPGGGLSQAVAALSWGTGPTVPTQFIRRVSLPGTIGASVVWRFEKGFVISKAQSLVLWNISAVALADLWVTIDE
jgi:hypothetical protein